MDGVTSFTMLLQVFTDVMNQPTAQTFRTLVVGWLLAPRRTVMGMVRASGIERHHASFHRLFAAAKWSVDQVGLRLFDLITRGESKVFLSVDDTLLPRTGLKVWGTGMHRDPMLSSRGFHVTRWGALPGGFVCRDRIPPLSRKAVRVAHSLTLVPQQIVGSKVATDLSQEKRSDDRDAPPPRQASRRLRENPAFTG